MERNGVPIQDADYRHGVSTGISYETAMPGLVPDWEEYESMTEANHTEDTWQAAPWRAKARAVAAHRIRRWIDLHTEDARSAAADRARRNSQARGKG